MLYKGTSSFPIVEKSLRSNECTQFYLRKIGTEQICGKPTISTNLRLSDLFFRGVFIIYLFRNFTLLPFLIVIYQTLSLFVLLL